MSKTKRRLFILSCLVIIFLIMVTSQRRLRSMPGSDVVAYPFNILNSATAWVSSTVKSLATAFEDNKQLKAELTKAQIERQKFTEILEENKRLRDLLSLREQTGPFVTSAEVIARGYDRFSNTLVIDKGGQNGVLRDMAVVTARGLVGKVIKTGGDFSTVLLLRDPSFSASIRFEKGRAEGVLSGTGQDNAEVKYVSFEVPIEKGEVLITSGLDGVFPPGIPVGAVSSVIKEGVPFFQDIRVAPFQPDSALEEVVILRGPHHTADAQLRTKTKPGARR